jgi:hypothetical protein
MDGHVVKDRGVAAAALLVRNGQVIEGVVEHGVCDEATRIVWSVVRSRGNVERAAVAVFDVIGALRMALELVDVDRLDVATMVLVEVGEAIVEEDRGLDVVGDVEAQHAHIGLSLEAGEGPGVVVARMAPLRLDRHLLLERGRHAVTGDILQRVWAARVKGGFGLGRLGDAVGVVDGYLLDLLGVSAAISGHAVGAAAAAAATHLRTCIQKQPADGRKYDADDEEEREDRLRGEDGPIATLLAAVRRCLSADCTYCHAFNRCCRNAVSVIRQYGFSSCPRTTLCRRIRLLGGRLLFVFLCSSRLGSWLDIESACSGCGVDMARFRANPRRVW